MYAQLPAYRYQSFDQKTLTFSKYPVIPPRPIKMAGEDVDADELAKNNNNPSDQPPNTETSEPAVEIIEVLADGRCNFHFQT
jgi:hypothetical protein